MFSFYLEQYHLNSIVLSFTPQEHPRVSFHISGTPSGIISHLRNTLGYHFTPQEHPRVANRPQAEVDEFRRANEMTVSQGCPKPILEFIEAGWDQNVMRVIKKNGFIKPTPIQVIMSFR